MFPFTHNALHNEKSCHCYNEVIQSSTYSNQKPFTFKIFHTHTPISSEMHFKHRLITHMLVFFLATLCHHTSHITHFKINILKNKRQLLVLQTNNIALFIVAHNRVCLCVCFKQQNKKTGSNYHLQPCFSIPN